MWCSSKILRMFVKYVFNKLLLLSYVTSKFTSLCVNLNVLSVKGGLWNHYTGVLYQCPTKKGTCPPKKFFQKKGFRLLLNEDVSNKNFRHLLCCGVPFSCDWKLVMWIVVMVQPDLIDTSDHALVSYVINMADFWGSLPLRSMGDINIFQSISQPIAKLVIFFSKSFRSHVTSWLLNEKSVPFSVVCL